MKNKIFQCIWSWNKYVTNRKERFKKNKSKIKFEL